MIRLKRAARPLALLACVVVVAFLFRAPILTAAGAYLVHAGPPQHADAILVLGGDVFGYRILKAAQLQQAGYAPYVLVSGPKLLIGHESDLMIEYARQQGFPANAFRAFNHSCDSTRDETELIVQQLKKEGVHKLLLVTSNFHTRRATAVFHKLAPSLELYTVAANDPAFAPNAWWKTRAGQKIFLFEWLKTISFALGN